jgi:hypothetical protein
MHMSAHLHVLLVATPQPEQPSRLRFQAQPAQVLPPGLQLLRDSPGAGSWQLVVGCYLRCATAMFSGVPPTKRLAATVMESAAPVLKETATRWTTPKAGTLTNMLLLLACHLRKGAVWVAGNPSGLSCAHEGCVGGARLWCVVWVWVRARAPPPPLPSPPSLQQGNNNRAAL